MAVHTARQNYCNECEAFINDQVNLKLKNSQVFASLAAYYDRDSVALPGLRDYYHSNYKLVRFIFSFILFEQALIPFPRKENRPSS